MPGSGGKFGKPGGERGGMTPRLGVAATELSLRPVGPGDFAALVAALGEPARAAVTAAAALGAAVWDAWVEHDAPGPA